MQSSTTEGIIDPIISGTVYHCTSKEPFFGITITVYNMENEQIATTTTDENGLYSVAFLSIDTVFKVMATYTGHNPSTQEVTVSPNLDDPSDPNLYGVADFELGIDTVYVSTTGSDSTGDGSQGNPFRTIQKGINEVNLGGTVYVESGTYKETLQDITKPLTLKSVSGPANTIIEGDGRGYVIFIADTNNVTIDGFTITNPQWNGGSDPSGIVVEAYNGPASNVYNILITNNIIHDVCSPTNMVVFGAVGINIGPSNGVEVSNNTIYNIHQGNPSSSPWWANGISIWGLGPGESANNVNVHDNIIYDISSQTPYDAGISIQGNMSNVNIWNNVLENTDEYGIESRGDGLTPINIEGNQISGNTIAGIVVSTTFTDTIIQNFITTSERGIQINSGSPNILSNTILGNQSGIYINDGTPNINFNRIVYNTQHGLFNLSLGTVNAENNWWGYNDAADVGNQISGLDVDHYSPWLVLSIKANPTSIPVGGNSAITADLTHNSDGFDTIFLGHVPNGIQVVFATDFGTINSPVSTASGIANSSFISNNGPLTAQISATVDNQIVTILVTVTGNGANTGGGGGRTIIPTYSTQGSVLTHTAYHTIGSDGGPTSKEPSSIEVANSIAEEWNQSNSVILVRNDLYTDALVAGPFSAYYSPILYTIPSTISQDTIKTMENLNVKKVIIIGGTDAVFKSIAEKLEKMGLQVERIAGKDRYETSALVAKLLKDKISKIFIVSGENLEDALTLAPYAAEQKAAILLTEPQKLNQITRETIKSLGINDITIIGGTLSVSANVEQELKSMGLEISRIQGIDRYDTAVKIAEKMTGTQLVIARGDRPGDALAAGAFAIKQKAILILVQKDQLPPTVKTYLESKKGTFTNVYFIGGQNTISNTTKTEIQKILG